MDTTILCVTHKEFDDSIVPDCYRVIKVGNMISDKRADELGYLRDNIDDNISNENPYYCELTAQYWGWKNLSSDIKYIGLCHYRRYFFDYRGGRTSIKNDILSADRIHDILQKHKIIMAFPAVKYPDAGYLYKNLPDSRQDKHWVIMESIMKSDYPEMYSFFMKVMYGKLTIWGNMLITTRDIFDEYSEWLFKVLKKYDKIIEEKGEMRIPRVDGFLS
ncbi:MAG: DUF4422 domain-containing protein, partial [Lachnospiraceae bacterium]|nr:DUF4422 domain-containing protein [Lachnospiraceae bacterium]